MPAGASAVTYMTTDRNVSSGVGALAWADADQVRLMEEKCILVDEKDQVIGSATKKECTLHQLASRHCRMQVYNLILLKAI
jgi:hypothetical protein